MAREWGPQSARFVCRGVGGAPSGPVMPLPGGPAGWGPRVDASSGVWGCGAGSPVGPGAGPICGCAVPRVCSCRVPTAAVFVGLGTALLPAGDTRCSRTAVAALCCGRCRCAACLDARSCLGLCGVPAPDGAGLAVVRAASVACGQCGELTVAWGVEVDGLADVEAVRLCGVSTPDGARARTFVALVAVVSCDRGRRVVMVAVLRVEEEELWGRAPPAIILATAHCCTCPAAAVGRTSVARAVSTAQGCGGEVCPST